MYKRRLVRWSVNWTDSWNREFHEAIEAKVHAEFRQLFPEGAQDTEETWPAERPGAVAGGDAWGLSPVRFFPWRLLGIGRSRTDRGGSIRNGE